MTIVDKVYQSLKNDILNLEMIPGKIITEQEISSKYDISRTPCRDVFQRLRSKGLIDNTPYKGNHVSLLNLENIKQMIYMRIAIEVMVIKDAIINKSEKIILHLEHNLKLQELLLKSEFVATDFYKLDIEFHKIWFEFTNNMFIWSHLQESQINYRRFKMLDIVVIKDFEAIYEDHKKLFQIIKNEDIDLLEETMKKHLNSGIKRLKDKIDNEFAIYFIKNPKEKR